MIRWASLLQILGFLLLVLAASLGVVLAFAWMTGDPALQAVLQTCAAALVGGLALTLALRPEPHEFTHREGILLVVLTWTASSFLGTLPFYLSGYLPDFADAFFESVSGFTTTGASVLSDVEALPRSLLLWRAMTQFLGGMGIIVLVIAILPLIGTGGMELYRAEFSGARSERLRPRIAETAAALWKIYIAFTLTLYVALRLAGMGPFNAACHSFTAIATGGFSTRNGSIEAFGSPAIELVIVAFMIMGGINFTRHYRLLVERQPRALWADVELRFYLAVIVLATAALTLSESLHSSRPLGEAGRLSLFQVTSILTTTGFSSSDFGAWSSFAQLVLLALMFTGGCTGSTAGGMKMARLVVLLRVVSREFRQLVERRGVFAVRLGDGVIPEQSVRSLLNLVYLAFVINFVACILLTATGVDVLTAISGVAATMFNIGPGLGGVGPAAHYGHLPSLAKWVLSLCMLAGRLEYYTVLVLFTAAFWRK